MQFCTNNPVHLENNFLEMLLTVRMFLIKGSHDNLRLISLPIYIIHVTVVIWKTRLNFNVRLFKQYTKTLLHPKLKIKSSKSNW